MRQCKVPACMYDIAVFCIVKYTGSMLPVFIPALIMLSLVLVIAVHFTYYGFNFSSRKPAAKLTAVGAGCNCELTVGI
jgi:hypothetical protein